MKNLEGYAGEGRWEKYRDGDDALFKSEIHEWEVVKGGQRGRQSPRYCTGGEHPRAARNRG